MGKQESDTPSSPEPEPLLAFKFPEMQEEEVYILRDEEGNIIARTKRELEKEKPSGK